MAFDKEQIRKKLADAFGAIKETDKATDKVATAIADALEVMIAALEVEVTVNVSTEVQQVPATVAINQTLKGEIK